MSSMRWACTCRSTTSAPATPRSRRLQQFPIGTLKIDQSFVRDVSDDAGDATIVRTIIDMGRSLGMEVVAEGVEIAAPPRVPAPARLPLRAGQAVRRALHRTKSCSRCSRARRAELRRSPVSSPRRMRLRAGSPDRKRRSWRRWVLLRRTRALGLRNGILANPQAAARRHAHRGRLVRRAGGTTSSSSPTSPRQMPTAARC